MFFVERNYNGSEKEIGETLRHDMSEGHTISGNNLCIVRWTEEKIVKKRDKEDVRRREKLMGERKNKEIRVPISQ